MKKENRYKLKLPGLKGQYNLAQGETLGYETETPWVWGEPKNQNDRNLNTNSNQ